MRSEWNGFKRIKKSRKDHRCACTGKIIPAGSSCWHYVGEFEGDFQSWYCSDEAKKVMEEHRDVLEDWNGISCADVGELMREMGIA